MEKYENYGMIGEGSYGMVMKCRHKETKQMVAIKKFIETEEDKTVKKIALREVRMLKQVRHENLINLIEVFRRKKRLYLVFEFMDHTALDDLEKFPSGADERFVKRIIFQVVRGVEFCHHHNILHRDVKPENILVSKRGVVKLCDFGFARTIAPPGEVYTDYVATRWYRAPELLVGDTSYGKAVDIWAIGCLFSEMLTGEPLFPGDSDIDQIYLITKCFGHMIAKHREIFSRNPLFLGMRLPIAREVEPLERRYPRMSPQAMDAIKWSLRLDPSDRPTCSQLLHHDLFTRSGWADNFTAELRKTVAQEVEENPLLKNLIPVPVGGGGAGGAVDPPKARHKTDAPPTLSNGQSHMPPSKKATGASDPSVGVPDPLIGGGETVKKKKKKVKKDPTTMHKMPATEKSKYSKHLSPIHQAPGVPPPESLLDHALNSSHLSLTGSVSRLAPLTPRHPLSPRQPLSPRHPLSPRQALSPRHPLSPRQLLSPHPILSPNPLASRPILSPRGHALNGHTHDTLALPLKPPSSRKYPNPASNSYPVPQVTFSTMSPPTQAPPPLPSHVPFTGSYSQNPPGAKSSHAPPKGGVDGIGSTMTGYNYGNPLRSNQPSDTDLSLISERSNRMRAPKLSPLPRDHAHITSSTSINAQPYLLSPRASARLSAQMASDALSGTTRVTNGASGGMGVASGAVGGASLKKQFSKSKDVVLPQLKDSDSQLMKMPSQRGGVSGGGAFTLASNSQTNGFGVGLGVGGVNNRGRVLGTLGPHMNSLEGYRTNPTGLLSPPSPPSHTQHNVR